MIHSGAKTILVVDDEADTREVLTELLNQDGYDIVCAENGLAALNYIQTCDELPALILLDLFMPGMDGRAFLRRAREDPRMRHVPVIVITAVPWVDVRQADLILSKPLRPEILFSEVRRFVESPC
jgi:CheY-like chemotaxis protein